MSLEITRGLSRAPLWVLLLTCLHAPTFSANPANYPGSVDHGNGTFTYMFRPGGGANNGTDQGGLTSGKDTFILKNESAVTANTNYGNATYAHHFNSTCNPWQGWSFFQWDVSALPLADEVTKVTLVLHATISRGYAWPYQVSQTELVLQAPATAWDEMAMTYNTRPALNPTVLGRAVLPTGSVVATNTWFDGLVRIDITPLYREWRSGTRPNFGVACLRPQAWCENANSTLVFSSDHEEVAKRPALEITYQGSAPDTTPPVITAPPAVLAEATSPQGAAIGFAVSALDDKDGTVPVVAVPPSGSVFPLGASTVLLTATDTAGNPATQAIAISVVDTTPPALATPANVVAEATGPTGAVAHFTLQATDLVAGPVVVMAAPASGSMFALGPTSVTATATDDQNNTSRATFIVTVQDTIAPVMTSVPANQVIAATSAAGAVATFGSATATDAVGPVTFTYEPASGTNFAIGTTPVTVTAKDAYNNHATGSFTVTVREITNPVITSVTPSIASLWPANKKMVPVTINVVATGFVGAPIARILAVTTDQPDRSTQWQITPGSLTVNLLADRHGGEKSRVYTITIEVRDNAGHVGIKATTVTVPHDQRKGG